jgi:hypothetical protein
MTRDRAGIQEAYSLEQQEAGPTSSEKVAIEVMNGPEDGWVVKCHTIPVTIGRADDNVVRLRYDQLISRHHAKIVRSDDSFIIHDLDSANGTFVRGKRVTKSMELEPNILFRVGATRLMLKLG